jgi:hypothetical protein
LVCYRVSGPLLLHQQAKSTLAVPNPAFHRGPFELQPDCPISTKKFGCPIILIGLLTFKLRIMKRMINTRAIAIALVAALSVTFTTPAMATDKDTVIPVELKFIGNLQNQPLFHMIFNGTQESEFTIIVRDQIGNVLHKEIVKGTSITKKFLLNTDELGDADLRFEISSKSYDKPVVFEINKHSRFVQDVVVTRMK